MIVSSPFRSARAGLIVLIALLIGAFGLRLWNLNEPSIWHDEAWSIRAIRDPIGTPDDNTPPVYYAVQHFLWLGAGETPFALRYGSVLLDLVTIMLAAQLIRRWAGWDAAILIAIFLGGSPLLWAYAREIRAYVVVPLLTIALLWLTDLLLKRFSGRVWIGLLLAELALLYSHNLSVPVVGWLNLVVGAVWLYQRRWSSLGIWIGGQMVILAAYLPWVLGQSPSGTPLNTPPSIDINLIWKIWQAYFAPVPVQLGAEQALKIGSVVFAMVALLSLMVLMSWNRNRRTMLLLSQAVLLPALATVELRVAHIDFHPRYYIAAVPATMMLVALGVHSLPDEFEIRRITIPAVIAVACGVAAASIVDLLEDPRYQHDDFRAIAHYYATLPEEAIILIPYGWEPALEEYYVQKAGVRAEVLGIKLHSDATTAMQKINAALAIRDGPVRVELLTWYQLPADVRGMYPCLLESAGRREGDPFTVQGLTTQGYHLEHSLALTPWPDLTADYGPVQLVSASAGGSQAVCVQTTWEVAHSSSDDWRVAGRMLTTNPPNWIIARSDSDVRQDDQAPTSTWGAGQQGDAFSLLRFPAGAPPGDYTLQLGIYSETEPLGLDRLTNGVPTGKLTTLGTIRPTETTSLPVIPPQVQSVPLGRDVKLLGHDASGGMLSPGQELRITLYWQVTGHDAVWSAGTLTLAGENWQVSQPLKAYPEYSLDWHTLTVPAEANGEADLRIEAESVEPITLASYTIEQTDRLFVPPSFDMPVQAVFADMALLEGFSVGQTMVSPDETLDLTLVWRVLATPDQSYRVFTHLLDANGQVVAQHDGFPASETRRTTGWIPGEYIVDQHALTFLRDDYHGSAHLEVGFYNPDTGERLLLPNGADHMILPMEIMVE